MSNFTDSPDETDCGDLSELSKKQCFHEGVEFGMFIQQNSMAKIGGVDSRVNLRSCHRERVIMVFEANGSQPDVKWINDDLISVRIGNAR